LKSLDTNILVAALAGEGSPQYLEARAALDGEALITVTVLLETSWVLRSVLRWSHQDVVAAFTDLLVVTSITWQSRPAVEWALGRYAAGADFADMLHLALSGQADSFATFDQRIARFADTSVVPVETLKG